MGNIFSLILTMSGLSAKVRDEHALNWILKSRAKEKQTTNDEIYDLTTVRTIIEILKKPQPQGSAVFQSDTNQCTSVWWQAMYQADKGWHSA